MMPLVDKVIERTALDRLTDRSGRAVPTSCRRAVACYSAATSHASPLPPGRQYNTIYYLHWKTDRQAASLI